MNSKIIIIGAGASGIAAATKLLENGFKNLVILEAENRIGGRIDTIPFGANVVDMGAQWCHGEVGNVVYELAKEFDVFGSETPRFLNTSYILFDGSVDDKNKAEKLMNLVDSLYENDDELVNSEGSVGDFIVENYQKALATNEDYKNIDPELAKEVLDFAHKSVNIYEASNNWFELYSKSNLYFKSCEGDQNLSWKDRGYKTILDILMKKYPDPTKALQIDDKILLNKIVSQINWNREGNNLVEVKCDDSSVYEADHVILTVSLGVLKERYLQLFNPEVPESKLNAIKGLSFGVIGKIYLEFSEPFWPDDWTGAALLWKEEDLKEIRDTDNSWLEGLVSFSTIDNQPNILCGWIYGEVDREVEKKSDEAITNGSLLVLRKFLPQWNIPNPIAMKNSKWFLNPNFRGAYSYQSTAVGKLKTGPAMLAAPLNNSNGVPKLLFGGEASSTEYHANVHGAIAAGWREAERIIDLYKEP